jgi:glycerol-3-phosphate O-acyltransferase
MTTGWLLLDILLVWIAYEFIRSFVVRRVTTAWRKSATGFVRRHRIQLESATFLDRVWIREALAQDPRIEHAIANQAGPENSVAMLRARADAYAEEIAPFFNLSAYYRFGNSLGRRVLNFCFELVVEPGGFERQLKHVPEGAVRVYVMNHRANMDPLVVAYGLLRHVPMSYAVGVWPLHTLFRAFGSYFVRRGEKDPLYHMVLKRFVQIIAGHGAVTGFFIEGGLSRDGKLRPPRTGLLDYLIGLRHDHPGREIVFMPVGLNYDRVFEDRILTREADGPLPKPTVSERLVNGLAILFWLPQLALASVLKVATRSHRKFGYAAVAFGTPLRLSEWPGGDTLHTLPDAERKIALDALGAELLVNRIGSVVPATPVPVFCEALRRGGATDYGSIAVRVRQVLAELRDAGAPLQWGAALASIEARRAAPSVTSITADLDDALLDQEEAETVVDLAVRSLKRRRVLREVVTPTGRGAEPVSGTDKIITYYANSLAQHLERAAGARADVR